MSIKYYQLAKDEEPPDEFCAVRDVGGEPSEYTFYVPEAENAKLREELDDQAGYGQMLRDILCQQTELCIKAEADNAKLRESCAELLKIAERHDPEWLHRPELHEELRKLGVEVDQ